MSSGKRSSSSASRGRPKRPRSTATPSTSTALVVPPATLANSTLDMEALTASITAAVTTAVQAAMERQRLPTAATTISVAEAVSEQLAEITTPTSGTEERGTSGASRNVDHSDKLVFSSLALELGGVLRIRSRPKFGLTSMLTSVSFLQLLQVLTVTLSLWIHLHLPPAREPTLL